MKYRHELPQVLMDLEPDIPPTHLYDLVTRIGTYELVHLQDVIKGSGDRYDVNWSHLEREELNGRAEQ
jgi:hypothetical protein